MGDKYLDKLVHFWRASQEKRGKNVFLFLLKGFLRNKEATNHPESAQLTTDKIWMFERKETSQHWGCSMGCIWRQNCTQFMKMLALGNFSVNSIFKKILGSVRHLLPNQIAMSNSL